MVFNRKPSFGGVNSPEDYAALEKMRAANLENRLSPAAIADGLGKVSINGVVSPEDSQLIRSGEHPVVKIEDTPQQFEM